MPYEINNRVAEVLDKTGLATLKISKLMGFKYPTTLYNILQHSNKVSTDVLERMGELLPDTDFNYIIKGYTGTAVPVEQNNASKAAEPQVVYKKKVDAEIINLKKIIEEKDQILAQQKIHIEDLKDHIKTLKASQKK